MRRSAPVETKPYVKPEVKHRDPPNGTFWKCAGCGSDNFGKFIDGELHIKYRERVMVVGGMIEVHCRFCGTRNQIDLAVYPYKVRVFFNAPEFDVEITEAALRLAQENELNIRRLQGSGKDGKIVVGDVKGALGLK